MWIVCTVDGNVCRQEAEVVGLCDLVLDLRVGVAEPALNEASKQLADGEEGLGVSWCCVEDAEVLLAASLTKCENAHGEVSVVDRDEVACVLGRPGHDALQQLHHVDVGGREGGEYLPWIFWCGRRLYACGCV